MKKIGNKLGNNKGFSLVEMIIVIAIMAILIAVIGPQLLKYIEKSKVAADQSYLNDIYSAVTYAIQDPEVFNDPASQPFIYNTMLNKTKIEDIPTSSKLYEEVLSTMGWTDLNHSTYIKYIKSSHASDSTIYFMYKGSAVNPVAMWISKTDFTGEKDSSEDPASYTNVVKCIAIK